MQIAGDFYTKDRQDHEPDPAPDPEKVKGRKVQSCTPRTASDGRGRTAGTLVAFWACGYMCPPFEMIRSESTTLVSTRRG